MVSSVGQFFGGLLCGIAVDKIGRRRGLAIGVLISCGGIIGQILSTTRVAFLMSKLILGSGLGFYLTIGPLYCSEVCATSPILRPFSLLTCSQPMQVSPVVLRGITTAGVNLGIVVGQLLSNAAIRGFGSRQDAWAYRGPFVIQLLFVGKRGRSVILSS